MAFCKYCGKRLAENEICNCHTLNNSYTPDINMDYDNQDNTAPDSTAKIKLPIKKLLLIPIIILIIILIASGISYSANAYRQPVKNIIKGINKNNIELILEQIMTKDELEEFKEDVVSDLDEDWNDFCDDTAEGMEELKEYIEDDFGKHFKVSAKIINSKDAKKREIKNLEKSYQSADMDVKIKKAYKLKTELTFKGKNDKKSMKLWVYSVKLKDEGWKLMLDEEAMEDFEYDLDDIIDTKVYREIADDIF